MLGIQLLDLPQNPGDFICTVHLQKPLCIQQAGFIDWTITELHHTSIWLSQQTVFSP